MHVKMLRSSSVLSFLLWTHPDRRDTESITRMMLFVNLLRCVSLVLVITSFIVGEVFALPITLLLYAVSIGFAKIAEENNNLRYRVAFHTEYRSPIFVYRKESKEKPKKYVEYHLVIFSAQQDPSILQHELREEIIQTLSLVHLLADEQIGNQEEPDNYFVTGSLGNISGGLSRIVVATGPKAEMNLAYDAYRIEGKIAEDSYDSLLQKRNRVLRGEDHTHKATLVGVDR